MAEKEMQAHDMVRRRSWSRAVALYDQILGAPTSAAVGAHSTNTATTVNANNSNAITPPRSHRDQQIACLLGRCECLLELGKYEGCLADARKVLSLLTEQTDCLASISRARRWLVHSLCKLNKYAEAEHMLREWINELSGQQIFSDISKTLERYKSILQMISGHHKATQKISPARLEDEMSILDTKLDHWATNNLPLDKYSKLLSNKGLKKREQHQNGSSTTSGSSFSSISSGSSSLSSAATTNTSLQKTNDLLAAIKLTSGKHSDEHENGTTCSYCAITFQTRNELRQHCQTETHQKVIMSDEGRDWKWRPPPRGFTLDSYSLCEAFSEAHSCHYGNQCVEAHGLDELNEWKERFEYRRMRVQKACEKELYGKSYTEQILERWIQATAPERIMCEKIDNVDVECEQELVTSISSKTSKREWVFLLKTVLQLKAVALLQDAHRNHFAIKSIKLAHLNESVELKSDQEWVTSNKNKNAASAADKTSADTTEASLAEVTAAHEITIEFHTEIYGTFRQAICFDFGAEPLLVKHLCVDVVPVGDAEKIEEIKRDIINNSATRWDVANASLVKFETTIGTHLKTEAYLNDLKHEKEMLERYPCPRAQTFTLTQSTIVEKRLTQNNYRSRIHELLYVEEIARYEHIARYNVRTKLTVTSNYILTPAGMATSTAKYSLAGELFALMRLGKDISEDTSPGRLILSNCSSVYISAPEDAATAKQSDKKRSVFEALIEDKGKNVIYLKLSAKCVEAMCLKADTEIDVDIQFQLNRLPYCEWHNAVDKITDFKIIFPATDVEPSIPWTPKKQWSESCEPKLNAKQREAVNAITTSLSIKLPPILLIGPFGTGKTYTLAQAIKQLLTQPEAKILICTHSNSAADLYIKEYLHPWIEEGLEEATPLRVYYHKRWVATVNNVVQKYCITDGVGNFRRPTVEDIMRHRIVVVTLSISMELASLGLPKGYFTHIFLDEAAQAMECEAIMPLALANDSTRIVLAGDHMQMSPELFSAFAKERKLHISLLERLYDHYPSNFPCKILLCENYRAHEAIIKFTSELFYEQKLIASGKQPRHERFYPLTFFTTRGEDIQDKNSTAFYNNAEVYEVVERVSELRKRWPSSWGKINDASIGIMTPYADQVFRIRSELRKRRMGGISVERVLNVQGKQFRAVFLSTVRTRRTCMPQMNGGPQGQMLAVANEDADYGFLSNSKLLNTAITRAQSLVAVVGDPVALCSIGRCRKVWERFIEICDEHKSLFGITWSNLRSQLDGVELKRNYVLNPLAPEFIPRAMQPEAYLREQAAMYLNNHHGGQHPGPPPHNVGMQGHPGMMGGPGNGSNQMPLNQMAAAMAASQMSHMFGQHSMPYNAATAAAMMAASKGNGGPHHFPGGHMNHMHGMRGPPPTGGPPQQPGAPPPHLRGMPPQLLQQSAVGNNGPYSQYMQQHWQQPLRPPNPGAGGGGGYPPPTGQSGQGQNPNASLWGPPPQSNPWSALPNKQLPPPSQQPPNPAVSSSGRLPPPNVPQTSTPGGGVIRGGSVPLQPPPLPSNQQPMLRNPSELGYLAKKTLYNQHHPAVPPQQQVPPPHVNAYAGTYQSNQLPMLGQRSSSVGAGGIPNGPISPMESPYMQRPLNGPQAPPTHNFFGSSKDKDYQFLNMSQNLSGSSGGMNNLYPQPPVPPSNVAGGPANKQPSPNNIPMRFPHPHEYTHLLPPNTTIYDMAFEAKETQYNWYRKLLETHGQEAANKFTEVLRQVMTTLHQQQHPLQNKPPPQLQLHGQQGSGGQQQQQLLPRDMLQPPPPSLNMLQQPAPPAGHQQRNSMPPYMHHGAVNSTPHGTMSTDDAPPLDGGINFNQQIDLVFNSIMNGNEIAQPILRDVLGMVGVGAGAGSGTASNSGLSNGSNLLNGDVLLGSAAGSNVMPPLPMAGTQQSRIFSMISGNQQQQQQPPLPPQTQQATPPQTQPKQVPPPHFYGNIPPPPPQQQQQQQLPQHSVPGNSSSFMGGNSQYNPLNLVTATSSYVSPAGAAINNKDFPVIGANGSANTSIASSSNSVPLYRRQALAMGNGNMAGNSSGGGGGIGGGPPNFGNSNPPPSSAYNMLTGGVGGGGTNLILPGLDTGANLLEALFQTNNHIDQQPNKNADNLLYNNYNNASMKSNDLELFRLGAGNNVIGNSLGVGGGASGGGGDNLSNNSIDGSHQHHHHHQHAANHFHSNIVPTPPESRGGGTTYAAVLSQGPQAQQQQQQQQQAQTNQVPNNFNHLVPGPQQQQQQQQQQQHAGDLNCISGVGDLMDKDPFAAIRELGQGTNGFYNYFQ